MSKKKVNIQEIIDNSGLIKKVWSQGELPEVEVVVQKKPILEIVVVLLFGILLIVVVAKKI